MDSKKLNPKTKRIQTDKPDKQGQTDLSIGLEFASYTPDYSSLISYTPTKPIENLTKPILPKPIFGTKFRISPTIKPVLTDVLSCSSKTIPSNNHSRTNIN